MIAIEPKYIYMTIPKEYVCVYHRILALLADYGEEMLKDCKAACKDRNSGVIECFNMFNSAVACHQLGKDKLAETLIKYVKAKLTQLYNGEDNSTSFVLPIDEQGLLKAYVSCGELPRFEINPDDMQLYKHVYQQGFDEHFRLGPEDESIDVTIVDNHDELEGLDIYTDSPTGELEVTINPRWDRDSNNLLVPCADVKVTYNDDLVNVNDTNYTYYFDEIEVVKLNDITYVAPGLHTFMVVVNYKGITKIATKSLIYGS